MFHQLIKKNLQSRQHTQKFRKNFALNRNAAGFSKEMKELVYTLVCDKA